MLTFSIRPVSYFVISSSYFNKEFKLRFLSLVLKLHWQIIFSLQTSINWDFWKLLGDLISQFFPIYERDRKLKISNVGQLFVPPTFSYLQRYWKLGFFNGAVDWSSQFFPIHARERKLGFWNNGQWAVRSKFSKVTVSIYEIMIFFKFLTVNEDIESWNFLVLA